MTSARPLALAGLAWALVFAALHVAWAAGSTFGLDGRRVTGALLVIDLVAIALCLLAAWIAWRLRHQPSTAPRAVSTLAWIACAVLSLRGGAGTIQALVQPPDDATLLTSLVDPYFLLGGILFGLLARGPCPGKQST